MKLRGSIVPGESLGNYRLGMSRSDVKRLLVCNHVPIVCEESARIEVSNGFFAFSDENEHGLVEIGVVKGFHDKFHSVGIGTTIHEMHRQLGSYVVRDDGLDTLCYPKEYPGIIFQVEEVGGINIFTCCKRTSRIKAIMIYSLNAPDGEFYWGDVIGEFS